ncbi:MAG: hypothetical protein O3C40_02660 [Planctomycetota bacterium]|nr:hypothetical protein [Planctomycetota bacterium]
MNEVEVTYQSLFDLLLRLGFEDVSSATPSRRVFRHQPTDTLLAFAEQPAGNHVREAELIATQQQLDYRGLLSESEFEQKIGAAVDAQT